MNFEWRDAHARSEIGQAHPWRVDFVQRVSDRVLAHGSLLSDPDLTVGKPEILRPWRHSQRNG